MKIIEEIHKLEKDQEELKEKIASLRALKEQFPNLKKHTNRWNSVRYCSKDVNDKVKRFDISHNCGCCNDSPLEIWPYLETEHGKVYSDPPYFRVGENSAYGDRPYPEWSKEMKEANIPEMIIGAVSLHFKKEKEEALEAVNYTLTDADDDLDY